MKKTAIFLSALILAGSIIIPETHSAAESSAFVYGDIDMDSEIDISDLTLLSQHLLRDITLEGNQFLAADVIPDGNTDILDIALLKQYIIHDNVVLGEKITEPETTEPSQISVKQTSVKPEVTDPSQNNSSAIKAKLLQEWPGHQYIEEPNNYITSENKLNEFIASVYPDYQTSLEGTIDSFNVRSDDYFKNNTLIVCRTLGGMLDLKYKIDSVSVSQENGIEIRIKEEACDPPTTSVAQMAYFISILSVPNDQLKGIELNENTISYPDLPY